MGGYLGGYPIYQRQNSDPTLHATYQMSLFEPRRTKKDLTWLETPARAEVALGCAPFAARGLILLRAVMRETSLKCTDGVESDSLTTGSATKQPARQNNLPGVVQA